MGRMQTTKTSALYNWVVSVALLMPACLFAQVTLERQVIASTGWFTANAGNISVTSTTGEAVISTFGSTNYVLTQGFHQPNSMLLEEISFTDDPFESICPDVQNGRIEVNSLDGCLPPYLVRLRKMESGRYI